MRVAWVAGCWGWCLLFHSWGTMAAEVPATDSDLSHSASREVSRTQETRLREAEEHAKAGRFADALAHLQSILDEEPAFLSRGAGYENSRTAAHRILSSLPAAGITRYEEQFGGIARAKFLAAKRSADLTQLRRVADAYRFTEGGYEALRFATLWHFDHGEYLAAAAGFQALSEHPLSRNPNRNRFGTPDALRWVIALSRVGLSAEAKRVAKEFRLGNSPLVSNVVISEGTEQKTLAEIPASEPLWKRQFALPGEADKLVQAMRKDLERRGFLPLPSLTPLVAGKFIIARGFEDITAYDRETGAVRWRKPIESQTIQLAQNTGLMANPGFRQMLSRQLATKIFADRNAGQMTSDGSRVFAVLNDQSKDGFVEIGPEEMKVPNSPADWNGVQSANCQLIALDLATGNELWRMPANRPGENPGMQTIRGPRPDVFFFGPPTPLGELLYVIGQKDREIRLYVLSAETGHIEWSLPLANTGLPISKEPARRRLALPVVAEGGLLLCPTGAGALAAVDPFSRNCRWVFRYARNDVPELTPGAWPAGNQNTHAGIDRWWTGWRDVGLVVENGTVVLASPESRALHAVSLSTGESLWTKLGGEGLLLSEGTEGQALLVGSKALQGIDLQTGETRWTIPTPTPAGRGAWAFAQAGPTYLVPLKTGGVLEVDLVQKISRRTFPANGSPWGNLVVSGDTVLLQSAEHLLRLSPLKPRTQPPLEKDQQLAWARSQREAGRFREAARVFKEFGSEGTAELRETLLLEIGAHPNRAAALMEELVPLLTSAEDRIRGWRAVAEAERQAGHPLASLKAWLKVMAENPTGTVTCPEDPALTISYPRYLQGAMTNLIQAADAEGKRELETHLEAYRTSTLSRRDPFAVSRFARRFDQLKWGRELIVQERHRTGIGQSALEQQLELWAIAEDAQQPAFQAMALRRLAEDRLTELRYEEAAFFYGQLQSCFANVPFPDGQTAAEFLKALPADSPVQKVLQEGKDRWPNAKPQITEERRNGKLPDLFAVPVAAQPGSLCEELDVWLDPQRRRLRFVGGSHRGSWELALPGAKPPRVHSVLLPRGWGVGPVLIFQYGTDLYGIAPLDDHGEPRPRVLWRLPMLEIQGGDQPFSEVGAVRFHQPPPGFGTPSAKLFDQFHQRIAEVGSVSAGIVIYQSGGRLVAIEPVTGRMVWSRSGLPSEMTTHGDASHIVLIHENNTRATVLRALDGRMLAEREVPAIGQVLTWWGNRVLLQTESQTGVRFSLWDAVTNRMLWQKETPPKSLAFDSDSDQWGFVTPAGELTLVNTDTGEPKPAVNLDGVRNPTEVYAVVDERRIFLAIGHENPGQPAAVKSPILDDLPLRHPILAGSLHGFDRRTGRALWHSAWGHWAMPLEQPATGPVLVLHHREKGEKESESAVLRCLEKHTGKEIYSAKSRELYESPRWSGHPDQNEFELEAYKITLRFRYE